MRQLVAKRHIDTWFLLIMTGALLVIFRIAEPGWLNSHTLQNLIIQNTPLALVARHEREQHPDAEVESLEDLLGDLADESGVIHDQRFSHGSVLCVSSCV